MTEFFQKYYHLNLAKKKETNFFLSKSLHFNLILAALSNGREQRLRYKWVFLNKSKKNNKYFGGGVGEDLTSTFDPVYFKM